MNLIEGILRQRDRLKELKNIIGEELYNSPEFIFYRTSCDNLIERATTAIAGGVEITEMIKLYEELKDFEA